MLTHMHERLDSIARRLDRLEIRLVRGLLGVTGFLGVLMTIYKFW